jgi:hypothetical protein
MKTHEVMLDYGKSACLLQKGKGCITVAQTPLLRDMAPSTKVSSEKPPKLLDQCLASETSFAQGQLGYASHGFQA